MRLFIGVLGDVGWALLRVVDRETPYLLDINQVIIDASAGYA